jgi:hypothetical protein
MIVTHHRRGACRRAAAARAGPPPAAPPAAVQTKTQAPCCPHLAGEVCVRWGNIHRKHTCSHTCTPSTLMIFEAVMTASAVGPECRAFSIRAKAAEYLHVRPTVDRFGNNRSGLIVPNAAKGLTLAVWSAAVRGGAGPRRSRGPAARPCARSQLGGEPAPIAARTVQHDKKNTGRRGYLQTSSQL